jgi:hypothetical protein
MRNVLLFCVAALIGVLAIVLVTWNTGLLEAFRFWYWLVAIPALCIVSAALGYWVPNHAWRWGVAPLFGQWLWELFSGSQIGAGNLGPFAHVIVVAMYALTAVPCVIAAEAAAYFGRKRTMSF